MVPVTIPYKSQRGRAVGVRGIQVPAPNANAESPMDMDRLPQALMGLNLLSSGGKALRSSDFVGFEMAPMRLSRAAFGERCVVANVNRNPRSSAKRRIIFFQYSRSAFEPCARWVDSDWIASGQGSCVSIVDLFCDLNGLFVKISTLEWSCLDDPLLNGLLVDDV